MRKPYRRSTETGSLNPSIRSDQTDIIWPRDFSSDYNNYVVGWSTLLCRINWTEQRDIFSSRVVCGPDGFRLVHLCTFCSVAELWLEESSDHHWPFRYVATKLSSYNRTECMIAAGYWLQITLWNRHNHKHKRGRLLFGMSLFRRSLVIFEML